MRFSQINSPLNEQAQQQINQNFSSESLEQKYQPLIYFKIIESIIFKCFHKWANQLQIPKQVILQKEMALKSTLSSRIYGDIDVTFNQYLEKFIFKWNDTNKNMQKYFEDRYSYNRLTMHPTEGRSIESIKLQYYLEESSFLFMKAAKLNKKRMANSYDCIELRFTAKESGVNMDEFPTLEQMMSSFDNFQKSFEKLVDHIISKFIHTPLGHPKKMKKDEEIDLLIFWGKQLRKKKAYIRNRINNKINTYPLLKPSFLDDTTWAGDRDGKKEIDAFHYCKFELESQKAFFNKLLTKLDNQLLEDTVSLGEIRITISKSDGSESMGSYLEPYLSTNNIVLLDKLCKVHNLGFKVLYGLGANDLERLAYHDSESIKPAQTLQGGNIPNFVNYKRIVKTLLRPKIDYNKDLLEEYLTNGKNKEFIQNFTNYMHKQHLKNYFGIHAQYQDFKYYSGRTLFRGPIVMDIQGIMGRASARGETRIGNQEEQGK
ncbi:hypothetical protein IMG5_079470 [Ichthyophthirius multifiliis]|uniref:Uncharacterized protein n=1 Tax=Ichthyophthirius multifiliis TaxID=5932 RepID=G0QQI4_ICHMU|nr:hypothetical protein IMG5_079470 [Ichthyophthirius multifiliis]EGR32519.1 hypothetical protein IMG5_079470 [Ichthyophthirius multifiliis]|eukprot:XP_004036505.1 hypothetical protein IMG5_079470 [Ichthyophthirius multifiliis]